MSSGWRETQDNETRCAWQRLFLQVESEKAGYSTIAPPVIKGESGVTHRFSFLCESSETKMGFDIYKSLNEAEVMTTYIKKFDTGARCFIVNLGEAPDGPTTLLITEYHIPVLAGGGIESVTPFSNEANGAQQVKAGP